MNIPQDIEQLNEAVNSAFPQAQAYDGEGAFISEEIIVNLFPNISGEVARQLTIHFLELAPVYKLNSPAIFPEYFALCAVHTKAFRQLEERFPYSAKRLTEVWPDKFPDIAAAIPYEYMPENLCNLLYADRMGNGPVAGGDGFKFRCAGLMLINGRTLHTEYAKYAKIEFAQSPELPRINYKVAVDSSMWYFSFLNSFSDNDRQEFKSITETVDGSTDAAKNYYLSKIKAVLPEK